MVVVLTPRMLERGHRIIKSGIYALSGNASILSLTGLVIGVSDVTLDLQGFAVKSHLPGLEAILEIAPGLRNVAVLNGTLYGSERAVYINSKCAAVTLTDLSISGYSFAGIVVRVGKNIRLTRCFVGRAASLPFASLFGVLALPEGGLPEADRILRAVSDQPGGDGLSFQDCAVADITPRFSSPLPKLDECERDCFTRTKRYRCHSRPFITDLGGGNAQDRTNCQAEAPGVLTSLEPRYNIVVGAGAHGVLIFNWRNVDDDGLQVALPTEIAPCQSPLRLQPAWGGRSAFVNTFRPLLDVPTDELSQVPLSILNVSATQVSQPGGAWVPGALGSFETLH